MPPKRAEGIARIKTVELERLAMHYGAERFLSDVHRDPTILKDAVPLRPRDIEYAAERLDGTYIIRLFAEFETGLRLFWAVARGGDPPFRTRDLVDGVAAARRIPDVDRDRVHDVRNYRHGLVHERVLAIAEFIPMSSARQNLCRFFSHLPFGW